MTAIPPRLALLEQEAPAAARLAEYASLAVRIDAGLLRRLRLALLPEADVQAESDLWFSPIVESRSATGFQISPSILDVLRDRLSAQPQEIRARVCELLDEAHVRASAAIRLEERVNGIAVEDGAAGRAAIEAALWHALRTMATSSADAVDIARWAMHAASRLHPIARDTPAARALFLAASLTLRLPRPTHAAGPSELPIEELASLVHGVSTATTRGLGVAFVTGGLQFREPASGGSAVMLPATDPLVVQIEWHDGARDRRELHQASPGTLVSLDGDPSEVTLTTLAGDQYTLAAHADSAARPAERRQTPSVEHLAACVRLARPGTTEAACTAFAVAPNVVLTARDGVGDASYLLDHDGRPYFVLPDPSASEHVLVLRAPEIAVTTTLEVEPEGVLPPGEARVAVPGFNGLQPVWRDAVLHPEDEASPWIRRGVVHNASADDFVALRGSPAFYREAVVGMISAITSVDTSSKTLLIEVVEASQLSGLGAHGLKLAAAHAAASARVFVCPTHVDLGEFEDAARDALLSLGHIPVRPLQNMRSTSPGAEEIAGAIDNCDVYVGIVGWQYGDIPEAGNPERLSTTELVYRRALRLGKPCLMLLAAPDVTAPAEGEDLRRILRFRDAVKEVALKGVHNTLHVCQEFRSPEEVHKKVALSIAYLPPERGRAPSAQAAAPRHVERLFLEIKDVDGRFVFQAFADGIAVERLVTAERQRVDKLLSKAPPFALDRGVLQTISDMLVPPQLRRLLDEAGQVVLRLDASTAPYPWELLLADMSTDPPAGSVALTRSMSPTTIVPLNTGRKALGVFEGTAPTAVTALRAAGLEVDLARGAEMHLATGAIMSTYECVYLAGAPVFANGFPVVSIGEVTIGLKAFETILKLPRLVFVQPRHATDWKVLQAWASQFATHLLSAGIPSVVCSGWVTEFPGATAFEAGFFADPRAPFASAVREGRRRAMVSGQPLDWAAFHCYGDPEFRLIDDTAPPVSNRVEAEPAAEPTIAPASQRPAKPAPAKRPVKAVPKVATTTSHVKRRSPAKATPRSKSSIMRPKATPKKK